MIACPFFVKQLLAISTLLALKTIYLGVFFVGLFFLFLLNVKLLLLEAHIAPRVIV